MTTATRRGQGSGGGADRDRSPGWDPRPLHAVGGVSGAEVTQQVPPAVPDRSAASGPTGQPPGARPREAQRRTGDPAPAGSDSEWRAGRECEELSSARLLRPVAPVPRSGWRAALYAGSGGLINPGESAMDTQRRELRQNATAPLWGCYRMASVSMKGGVGKTTVLTLLGMTFASLRGDRVVAMDANPDRGNLVERARPETSATVRDLLCDAGRVTRYSHVRAYTSQGPSRLEVLASENDPEISEAFSAEDYRRSSDLLAVFYNLLLTDCGTGMVGEALQAAVGSADSLLIVTSASIDGARSAQATVEWLEAHGFGDLVARSVTVINGVRPGRMSVDLDAVARYFAAHTREVVRLPFDPHIDQGGELELEALSRRMRDSLLGLAATVAEDFPRRSAATDPARPQLAPSPQPGPPQPGPPRPGPPGQGPPPEGPRTPEDGPQPVPPPDGSSGSAVPS